MRSIFLLIAGLLCWTAAAAQVPTRSLLWKVTGKGLPAPSYVFGTIHLLCPDDVIWTPAMDSSLKTAAAICMELDLDDPETVRKMMAGLRDTSSRSLRASLAAADYSRLKRFAMDSAGIALESLDDMDPATVPLLFISKLLPCDAPASYEARIAMEALGSGKPIEGLESVEDQLALLGKLGSDSSAKELMSLVDSFSVMRRQFSQLVASYKEQDLDALAAMIASSPVLGGQTDAFLSDRNRRWIKRLEDLMQQKALFVAVGAGHLPGPAGVLELLRRAGYTVAAVR